MYNHPNVTLSPTSIPSRISSISSDHEFTIDFADQKMREFRERWNLKPSSDRSEKWMRDQLNILLDDPRLPPEDRNRIATRLWETFYEMRLVDSVDSNGREKGRPRVLDSNKKDGPDIVSLVPGPYGVEGERLGVTGWLDDQQSYSLQPPLSQQRQPQTKPPQPSQQPQQPQQYQQPQKSWKQQTRNIWKWACRREERR